MEGRKKGEETSDGDREVLPDFLSFYHKEEQLYSHIYHQEGGSRRQGGRSKWSLIKISERESHTGRQSQLDWEEKLLRSSVNLAEEKGGGEVKDR